jgi:hypothetical protein
MTSKNGNRRKRDRLPILDEVEGYVSLSRIAEETNLPMSFYYDRSRRGTLPGMTRLGRFILVHRQTFYDALRQGGIK